VTYNDHTTASFTATLSGIGVAASTTVAVTPTAINFQKQVVGQGIIYQNTVTVTNTGNTPVTIGTSTTSIAQFPIGSDGCSSRTIQPGGSCSYNIGFAPTSVTTYNGTLTIPDNAAGHPHTVALAGTGIAATSQVVLSQTSIGFGNVTVGVQSPVQVVFVTNQGATSVTVGSITVGGTNPTDFSESSNCTTLGADTTCQIYLYFTPSGTGLRSATVTEADSAAGSPRTITLKGTGVAATTVSAELYPSPLTFPSTQLNSSAMGSFSFTAQPASAYTATTNSGIEVGGQLWYFEASAGSTYTGTGSTSDYSIEYASGAQIILIGDTPADTVLNVVAALNNSPQTACGYKDPTTTDSGHNTCYRTNATQTAVTAVAAGSAVNLTATVGGAAGNCTGSTCYSGYGWSSNTTILGTGDVENISPPDGGLSGGIGAPQIFSVTNNSLAGGGTLTISKVKSNSLAFPLLTDACTGQILSPGQNCTVSVTFAPTAVGTNSSTISVTDTVGTQTESVSGTGTPATSTTTLVSSLNPSLSGQSVTFTATVSGFSPTGTVAFTSNTTAISGCSAVTLTASLTAVCTTTTLPVGTDTIAANYSGDTNNNPSSNSPGLSQVVNAKWPSTTKVVPSLNPSTYGQAVTFTATVTSSGSTPTGTMAFTANSVTISGCSAVTLTGSATAACNTTSLGAGTDSIVATYSGDTTHASSISPTVSQVVNQATLTVTAQNASMTFGGTVPTFTYNMTGFVNGDTQSGATTGAPSVTTTATSTSAPGSYPITAALGTLAAANYTFTFVNGTLTDNPAPLVITASSGSMNYGGTPPIITPNYAGFVNGNTAASLTTKPTCSTTATSASPAGTYPSSCSGAVDSNYSISYVNGSVTDSPVVLTITAGNGTMNYGGTPPTITATYKGFVNGDTSASLTPPPTCSTAATSASAPGSYPSSCSGAVDNNYTFNYVNGSVTVNAATLTVTATNHTKSYGAVLPTLTYTMTGFVNGDTQETATTGAPTLTTTARVASPLGTYPITVTIGTLAAANYKFKLVNGNIFVVKATLTVTAQNASMIYGATVPALTYTIKGFVLRDTQGTAITGAPDETTTATSTSKVATYTITVTLGTLAANNYTFKFVNGKLTIDKATLTVTANNLTKTQGSANPTLTYTMTGFVNGDTQTSATSGAPKLTTTAITTSPVGTYPITVTAGTLKSTDYALTFVAGTLTVTGN